jgi:hypothetical protein
MSWSEAIHQNLPPPDPGMNPEPADLRRDIADELADHLECAMQRELRATEDETRARRAVLQRFGDPKRIAQRLWFDAMKETIMTQRITLITNIVLALAVVILCIVTITAVNGNRAMTEKLVTKLEALTQTPENSGTQVVWSELSVHAVDSEATNRTISGLECSLRGEPFNPGTIDTINATTDNNGVAHFGPIRPGRYFLRVRGQQEPHLERYIILYPGDENREQVEWIRFTPQPATVSLDVHVEPVSPSGNSPGEATDSLMYYRLSRSPVSDPYPQWEWPDLEILTDVNGRAMIVPQSLSDQLPGGSKPSLRRIDSELLALRDHITVDGRVEYVIEEVWKLRPGTSIGHDDLDVYSASTVFRRGGGRASASFYWNLRLTTTPGEQNVWRLTPESVEEDHADARAGG